MTKTIIRKIKESELDQLIDLYQHLVPEDDPLPSEDKLLQLWQAILVNPLLHYLVAEVDQRIVSSCTLAVIPNLTRGTRPYGLIEHVVTHSDYRKRGLATAVLHKAVEIAWDAGCYKVMLLTGSKRPETLRFYEQAGFNRHEKTGFIIRSPQQ